ncbi:hypothetical protein BDZ90DRAFT_250760 [Jaminaea rosea]|uniref:protein kinase C n=1 Tax=Jaminaea rosea TaxID=1569628 RepID=A0A316UVG8_9BASI|nr:hypothetical protein BDZ90DRAFT_250760 [Jaminaea rosea]PWN28321.1 hypothetical protein BDZ90DRAFT_250760 [Jaminaea rosea]
MADSQAMMADIQTRIQKQRQMIKGFQAMRSASANPEVQRQAESNIRDAQRNVSYLEESLQALMDRGGRGSGGGGVGGGVGAGAGQGGIPSSSSRGGYDTPTGSLASQSHTGSTTSFGPSTPGSERGSTASGPSSAGMRPGYPLDASSAYRGGGPQDRPLPPAPGSAGSDGYGGGRMSYSPGGAAPAGYPQRPPQQQDGGGQWMPAPVARAGTSARRNFTNLDLIKYETPLTTAKISRMLHQLEFKLQIERQYKMGIDKMAALYQAEGDRKSKKDAESKRVESEAKIMLLQNALKRYKQLHVMDDDGEDDQQGSTADERRQNLRKPLSGTLQVSVKATRDLEHAPTQRYGRGNTRESTVVIKVEDTPRARTHPSRTDRWQEDFELAVDNANEIEVTVYDKVGSGYPVPIGMLWIRISDIVEELRKKKFGQTGGGPSEAGSVAPSGWVTADDVQAGQGGSGGYPSSSAADYSLNQPAGTPVPNGPTTDGVEAWFAVEPAGAVFLRVNFVKQNVRKRPYDARLGRQGAFRKKKEDVAEINGHKFVSRQFYQIIRCALCGELLLNAAGSQCEDCRYTCHKKCAQKVVTKCISKSNAEADRDEVKINHRIPHRFEPITNIGANWCCHCGFILPLGRKNARKCSECDITCHSDCAHLVPDFCGMSMEMANQLLSDIETINRVKHSAKQQQAFQQQAPSQQQQQQQQAMLPPRQQQMPPQLPLPGFQQPQQQQGRNDAGRYDGGMSALDSQASQMSLNDGRGPYPGRPQPPQRPDSASYGSSDGQDYGARPGAADGQKPPRPLPQHPPQQQQQQQARPPPASAPQLPPLGYSQQQQQQQSQQSPAPVSAPSLPTSISAGQVAGNVAPPAAASQQQQQQQRPQPGREVVSSRRKVGLNDFNFLAVLGKGNFGKVMLAEEKRSANLYAIKVLKKEFIIENDEVESTKSEKRVFLAAARERHPFLLGLHSCFQTETRVYFVMEYVSGGDLMLHIQREQFSPKRAKFYAAEVLLALEYFHKQGIIYRDLKLDNILLTLDGHVKVADYGLCKEGMWYGSTTNTFCGTPEFMAPEILMERAYDRSVDWWAFGILIYEMLLGQAPFRGDDEDEIFDAILEDEPLYPIHMPADSVSILHRLLTRDPSKRLGSGETDAEEIKAHPFFRDTNWDDMYHKRVPPPFRPVLKHALDVSFFDQEFTQEKPALSPVNSVLSPADQQEFAQFSWVSPAVM